MMVKMKILMWLECLCQSISAVCGEEVTGWRQEMDNLVR